MDIREIVARHLKTGHRFTALRHVYTYSKTRVEDGGVAFDKVYSLYEGCPFEHADPVLLMDYDGMLGSGQRYYTLKPVDDIVGFWDKATLMERHIFEDIVKSWGLSDVDKNIKAALYLRLFKPVGRLVDTSFINEELWGEVVDTLLSFGGADKDPQLMLVYRSHLLRGYKQVYNPHTIMATNPGTGKTAFYEHAGSRYDKASANSIIGYAKGKSEVYYGAIHGQNRVFTLEQIESQLAETLLAFLLTFMESGSSTLHTGGVEMQVSGACPIVITANPTGYDTDKIGTFKALIDHLTTNHLALGRRFGVIVYGMDYKTVDRTARLNEEEWGLCFDLFRAVEAYAWPAIVRVYEAPEAAKWLNAPLPDYEKRVTEATDKIYDSAVKDFTKTHARGAYQHLRGAAFSCAVVDLIPYLIRSMGDGAVDLAADAVIGKAEEYLEQFVNINLVSFANMVSTLESSEKIKEYLVKSFPNYIKEIIYAVDALRAKEANPPREIPLLNLDPYMLRQWYDHFSEIIDSVLKNSRRWKFYSQQLERYFKFRLRESDKTYIVELMQGDKR